MIINGGGRLGERDAVLRSRQVHRGDPAEVLLAPADAVDLPGGIRYPGDQVRREEFTHPVQVSGIEGIEQVRCDVDGVHRFTT
jgi:hypothetical protein